MESLKQIRQIRTLSQRLLARKAGIAYKTLQLLESGAHDPRLSTLQGIATALGYPQGFFQDLIQDLWQLPPDCIAVISRQILRKGEKSWKLWLLNFVDAFRSSHFKEDLILDPPSPKLSPKLKGLLASTVETLSQEGKKAAPEWCHGIPPLREPWFVSGIENLKATALLESPVHFRKRNIFVLGNFLERR